jgi:hypothetical protein
MQRLPRGQALAGHRLHLVGVGQVRSIDRLVPPPTSVATLTATRRLGGAPVEQAAAEEQVGRRAVRDLRAASRSAARSASSSQMPCANTLARCSRPARA